MHSSPSIVALVATRYRADLLLRLLNSLAHQTLPPTAVVICDNGPDSPTAEATKKSPLPSEYLSPGKNLGFGGGLALAGQHALQKFHSLTHLLIVDDDAILAPTDLATLLSSMQKHSAGSIAPFLVDSEGKLQEVPEPTSWSLARAFRTTSQNLAAARALALTGYPMAWCIGPCLLADRSTWLRAGPPRSDMIAYGDDIEFSLRLSAASPSWAEPSVAVTHAPPTATLSPSGAPPESARLGAKKGHFPCDTAHRKKFGMLLQNLAFTCVNSPRPRHLPLYLPGNARRFLQIFGFTPANTLEVIRRYTLGLLGFPPRAPFDMSSEVPHLRDE